MYRVNRVYDVPPANNMELPQTMYNVKPVNGHAAGLYSAAVVNGNANNINNCKNTTAVNGNNVNNTSALTEQNRNSVKSSPRSNNNTNNNINNSPRGNNKAGKRKRSKSRSPTRGNNPAVVKKEQQQGNKGAGRMTNENANNSADAAKDDIIANLEARQQVVIAKLLQLRDTLNNLGATTGVTSAPTGTCQAKDEIAESVEVVVNADPANPPYSVLFLSKLLRDNYGPAAASLKSYQHSSVDSTEVVKSGIFNQPLALEASANKTLNIAVIWRKVEDGEPELLVQPSVQAPVTGEANVARYLSRLLPSVYPIHYDTLSWDDVIRVDAALEKAADGLKDLSDLEQTLANNQPFICGEATIADFVTFSAVAALLKKNPKAGAKFPNVSRWFKACQEFGGFRV